MSSSFVNEDKIERNITGRQFFKKIYPYLKRHPNLVILILVSIGIQTVATRLMPWVIGQIVEFGALEKNVKFILEMALLYLGLEITKSTFSFLNVFFFQKLGNRILFYVREDLAKHIMTLPIDYFNRTPTGRTITRMTSDISAMGDLFTDGMVTIFINALMLIAIIISMSLISLKLTFAILITTPIFIGLSLFLGKKIKSEMAESKKLSAQMNSFASENLSGIKTIQIYNRQFTNLSRFSEISQNYKNTLLKTSHFNGLLYPLMHFFGYLTVVIGLIYGGFLKADEALATGALITFILHAQDFMHPLRDILEKIQQFQNSLTSADRVFLMFDEKSENYQGEQFQVNKGEVEIKNLNFSYSGPFVLKNLNLKIDQGKKCALIGRTGSGKTTLISLLQRFYEPPAGTIFIDGLDITLIDKHLLRRKVGVIQQDPFLFKGTISQNISLEDPFISKERVDRVAKSLGLSDYLKKSNRNLESSVAEKGENLSLGERQLIAFARILVFEPQIIILDEATANVDSETEFLIQKATEEVTIGRTSIIIAHRLSTIEHADEIFVLNEGELLESGPHLDLLNRKGLYYQMYTHHDFVSEGI